MIDKKLLNQVTKIAIEAGREILFVYESDDFDIQVKSDESLLTRADINANEVIVNALTEISRYPVVSEENSVRETKENTFWLIDPLDGTKEFIKRNGEFTVNIALIFDGEPILGVVYAPAKDLLYKGLVGSIATKKEKGVEEKISAEFKGKVPIIITSRSHRDRNIDKILATFDYFEEISCGSSLKLCMVAEGKAALYPRLAPTYIWDTAAADAVVRAAGGRVVNIESKENIYYSLEGNLKNPYFLVGTETILNKIIT
jgi:3'(2'), 5'-bisphosphate nucleotidase